MPLLTYFLTMCYVVRGNHSLQRKQMPTSPMGAKNLKVTSKNFSRQSGLCKRRQNLKQQKEILRQRENLMETILVWIESSYSA